MRRRTLTITKPTPPLPTLRQLKAQLARRRQNLKDPHWGHGRVFPLFRAGLTTTAGYIERYQLLNDQPRSTPLRFTHATGHPASFLVGPEVVEEQLP